MKKNTVLILIITLGIFTSLNAQKKNLVFIDSLNFGVSSSFFKKNIYNQAYFGKLVVLKDDYIDINKYSSYIKKPFFQTSNDVSLLNDVFININGEYVYSESILIPENLNRNIKINSFNPLGFTKDEGSFLVGALDLILNQLQK